MQLLGGRAGPARPVAYSQGVKISTAICIVAIHALQDILVNTGSNCQARVGFQGAEGAEALARQGQRVAWGNRGLEVPAFSQAWIQVAAC